MSSAAQSRANAQHSTGPRTEAGKAVSSQNARKHGLTGKQIVMPGEDPAQYDDLRAELHASYRPANEAERILVDQIAASSWRLDRPHRLEASAFQDLVSKAANADQALAGMLLHQPDPLLRIQRYITQFERAYYRAIKELQTLQRTRVKTEQTEAKEKSRKAIVNIWASSAGFVSQKPAPLITNSAPETVPPQEITRNAAE